MDTANPQTWIILGAVAGLVVIGFSAWSFVQKKRSRGLQERFGSEYGRTVEQLGSQSKAESELNARTRRVASFNLLRLEPADAARFSAAWLTLQSRFVDDPKGVLMQADHLVRELMGKRGYPVGDFEHRAADISVDHPRVVEHFRALFDELLEVRVAAVEGAPLRQPAVLSGIRN